MPYTVTGSATFSSQANRDAAQTRVNSAIAGMAWAGYSSAFTAGVTTSGTTILNISIAITDNSDVTAANVLKAVIDALVLTNRHTSGWVGINKT
jgi:hypothetical protein